MQRIGQAQGPPNVKYFISPNGTVMTYVSCSDRPFRLQVEEDISRITVFLSRVKGGSSPFSHTQGVRYSPRWTDEFLECDVNKDM
jgi:hypothetical protein